MRKGLELNSRLIKCKHLSLLLSSSGPAQDMVPLTVMVGLPAPIIQLRKSRYGIRDGSMAKELALDLED